MKMFTVLGIVFWPILQIIKAAYEDPVASFYHFIPHKLFCCHPPESADALSPSGSDGIPEFEETWLFGEIYTCSALLEKYEKIN